MKKPTICRYCGGIIRLVPAADVYGSSTERLGMQNEYLYQCQNCNARVGCHKGTTRPLGDVANEILRLKRTQPDEDCYRHLINSKKIFEKLLAKVKRFDYEFQAACVKEQNFEKLEMYVMDLLMGD